MVCLYPDGPRAHWGINITPSQGVEIICSQKMHYIFSLYYSDYLQGYKQIYPLSVDLQGYKLQISYAFEVDIHFYH